MYAKKTSMDPSEVLLRLSALLLQTKQAHHRAFIATDGDDPEWPLWYAGYLQPRLQSEFGLVMTQSELVYWLLRAEKQRAAEGTQMPWPDYYAERWLAGGLF